jgi:Tol biopolymer transport system component
MRGRTIGLANRIGRGSLLPALSVCVLICSWSADGAQASYPGSNGRIAFVNLPQFGADQDIYSMDAGGGHRTRLTKTPDNDAFPSFSGDGERIAFSRGGDSGRGQIWIMKSDGGHARELTAGPPAGEDRDPSLSPDGRWIAFTRELDGVAQIWAMSVDGSHQRQLTFPTADGEDSYGPTISPDGRSIAFSHLDTSSGFRDVSVMDADGSDRVSLTAPSATNSAYQPDWSPDGSAVVFDRYNGIQDDLAVVSRAGSSQTPLTSGDDLDFDPAFAPDGETVALERNAPDFSFANIFRVDSRDLNGHEVALTHNTTPVQDFEPAWQALNPPACHIAARAKSIEAVEITLRCSNENATVRAKAPKIGASAVTAKVAAKKKTTRELTLSDAGRARLKRALAAGQTVTSRVTARFVDDLGQKSSDVTWVEFAR